MSAIKKCLISALLLLSGCKWLFLTSYKKGDCFEEQDKRYIRGSYTPIIYRINRVKLGLYISSYSRNKKTWQQHGRKGFSYFDETDIFHYKTVPCPGDEKIKEIGLKNLRFLNIDSNRDKKQK